MDKRLKAAGVPYFTTIVTRSQMEIPASFVRDYGEKMKPTARLRLDSGSKIWPVQIQVCYSVRFRVRFCNRWRRFLSENGLRTGDELIVSLVDLSEFVIYLLKKSRKTEPKSSSSEVVLPKRKFRRALPLNREAKVERNVSDNFYAGLDPENSEKPIERHAEILDYGAAVFQKRMSEASTGHFGHPRFARIEIPAEFARCHGKLLGDGTVIILEGPMPGTSAQVVCRHEPTSSRIMWRRGWPNFVARNNLRKGDDLQFALTAPNRFSVRFMDKKDWSARDLFFTKMSDDKKESRTSSTLPPESVTCTDQSAAVDTQGNLEFIKILPASSITKMNAYPFLVIPTSFWHFVTLPPKVKLQGPNSNEIFSLKCSGEIKAGATKNLSCGWRDYADTNALKFGDKLRFSYEIEEKLFVVTYA